MTNELKTKIQAIIVQGAKCNNHASEIADKIAEVVDAEKPKTEAIEHALGTLSAFIDVAQNGYDTQFETTYRLELQAARAELEAIRSKT
jgi:uncharacterized protein with gpF-like domain